MLPANHHYMRSTGITGGVCAILEGLKLGDGNIAEGPGSSLPPYRSP